MHVDLVQLERASPRELAWTSIAERASFIPSTTRSEVQRLVTEASVPIQRRHRLLPPGHSIPDLASASETSQAFNVGMSDLGTRKSTPTGPPITPSCTCRRRAKIADSRVLAWSKPCRT